MFGLKLVSKAKWQQLHQDLAAAEHKATDLTHQWHELHDEFKELQEGTSGVADILVRAQKELKAGFQSLEMAVHLCSEQSYLENFLELKELIHATYQAQGLKAPAFVTSAPYAGTQTVAATGMTPQRSEVLEEVKSFVSAAPEAPPSPHDPAHPDYTPPPFPEDEAPPYGET